MQIREMTGKREWFEREGMFNKFFLAVNNYS